MSKSRTYSSSNNGANELYDTLSILSQSGVDIASRKLFLKKMSNQLCCRTLNEANKFNPTLGPPGSSPTRDEIEAWIGTLNQYTRYLSSLLASYDEADYNEYIAQRDVENEYDSSSEFSSEINADKALRVLINRARNSPKSNVSERATQTILSPTEKSTQTPPQKRYYEKSTSTSKRSTSPIPNRVYSPLSRSQPSRQSRGTEISPPPEIQTQTKSLLAQRIENSPRFLSYNDPDEDVVAEIIDDNCYQTTNRGVNASPKHSVYIISPKKREEETQTFGRSNDDDNEIEIEYTRSWKRTSSKSLSPNSSTRRRQQSPKKY